MTLPETTSEKWDPKYPYRLVGNSPVLRAVRKQIEKVAVGSDTVLITGETGVGKELIARNLHFSSQRREKSFVAVNCGGISESLLEGELFGHEPHSFTGAAASAKAGKIEAANMGTFFLDEVGELSPRGQLSLLRVLETKTVCRVGGSKEIPVNFRLLAATNVPLESALREGKLREDFYYRINLVRFSIPPLRERKEDIAILASYFVDRYCQERHLPLKTLDAQATEYLVGYHWPGNVRQLEAMIKVATLYVETETISRADLENILRHNKGEETTTPKKTGSIAEETNISRKTNVIKDALAAGITPDQYMRSAILMTIEDTRGNQSEAARKLGLSRDQLRYRLEQYGLLPPPPKRTQSSGASGNVISLPLEPPATGTYAPGANGS